MKVNIEISGIEKLDELYSLIDKFSQDNSSAKNDLTNKEDDEFVDMNWRELSEYMNEWIRRHFKDRDICVGLVENIFKTPVLIYKKEANRLKEKK